MVGTGFPNRRREPRGGLPCTMLAALLSILVAQPASSGQGGAVAPCGVSQFPDLLRGYPVRPAWQVAGVDFYVGAPEGAALKSPASLSLPGVTVTRSTHTVTVSRSDVTLSELDFGLDGGWQVNVINNASNVVIEKSRFQVGANNLMPIQAYYGGSIIVRSSTFDGGASDGSSVSAMVFTGSGGATIEYNRFTNFPNDGVDITRDGTFVIQFNMFDRMGAGAFHTDAIQTYLSAISSLSIRYNTAYQSPGGASVAMNAFVRIGDQRGNVVHSPVAAYNTIIMTSTAARSANVFQWDSDGRATLLNPQIHDNFIDPTGVMYGIVSPVLHTVDGVINPVSYNNINLLNGKQLLNSLYNSQTSGVPAKPPAAPEIVSQSAAGLAGVTLIGTSRAGETVTIYDQAARLGAAKVGRDGVWQFVTPPLAPGDHEFTARSTTALANSSAPSRAVHLHVRADAATAPGGQTVADAILVTCNEK